MEFPISTMTTAEKLAVMEQLWASLQNDPNHSSPDWHQEVLTERKRKIENGETTFSPINEVHERISKARN